MIFLIGMPGAGKTYWGQEIANECKLPFVDTDQLAEQIAGCSIAEYFAKQGEALFRQLETIVLERIVREWPLTTVVSCGGGLPINERNYTLMKEFGCIVYLKAQISTLLNRIAADRERPLLNTDKKQAVLMSLLEERRAIYELADYIILTEKIDITNFDPIVKTCIKQR